MVRRQSSSEVRWADFSKIEPTAWTPDDVLTPTFKLKRKDAKTRYQKEIDELYSKLEAIAGRRDLKQGAAH
jgi:long-subunit acyl-CoA synthetase (AMP-forming)